MLQNIVFSFFHKNCQTTNYKMTIIQLKEFVKTGKFGTITIGSTKTDVINLLGNKYSFGDLGETQIIKYGAYEFFYWTETEIIFGIQNDQLQADCSNHKEMINLKNKNYRLDKWFLQNNKNITFGEVIAFLEQESIFFEILPASISNSENVIKCLESNVSFDFVNEYDFVELDEKGKVKTSNQYFETEQSKYVLNGIRLFEH